MLEGLVRAVNNGPRRFTPPLVSDRWSHRRALIAEVAFGEFVRELDGNASETDALHSALVRVGELTGRTVASLGSLTEAERIEASAIRDRLQSFVARRSRGRSVVPRPAFAGCGFVNAAEGDFVLGEILYEVKAANRTFRVVDLRQALVYLALNFAKPERDIRRVGLLNPLQGTWEEWGVDEMCWAIAGRPSGELMRNLIEYMSSDFIGPPDLHD